MKEQEQRLFRPYLVCFNKERCIGNMSLSEVEKQIRIGDVDWITHNRQFMGKVELMIYKAYLITKDQMEVQGSPSNVNIATKINETLDTEHQLSRDAICQVRKKIACVMGFKSGW